MACRGALVVAVLFAFTWSRPCAAQAFGVGVRLDFPAGTNPRGVALADLNDDGKLDMVVANANSNTVSVMLGNGAGTFGPKTDYATGGFPLSVAIGDLNGDGIPDLAVANLYTNTISVLPGNGAGGFGPKTDYSTGNGPLAVAIGDLNGDGRPDLAFVNYQDNTVSVLLNTGASFAPRTDFGVGTSPFGFAIGDLNADGNLDLVVANLGSNTVSVLLGDGSGGFAPKMDFGTGTYPGTVAIGDLNNDGVPDLAVPNEIDAGTISVLLGTGGGSFAPKTDFPVGTSPRFVAIGDVNGDGQADLVAANYGSANISVMLGDGSGGFSPKTDFASGNGPSSVALGDVNGDGSRDIAVANDLSNTASLFLNKGGGGFGPRHDFVTGGFSASVAIGDLNRDGTPDLAVANSLANSVSVFLGRGGGDFGPKTDLTTGSHANCVALADLNADGKLDMVASVGYPGNNVSVWLGDGAGGFGSRVDYPAGSNPQWLAIGDVNNDGKPDLAVANYADNSVSILLGNGSGGFGAHSDYPTGTGPVSVAIGDFNSDGKPDLVLTDYYGDAVSVLLGNGSGGFGPHVEFATGNRPNSVAIGDLNRDGKPDLAVANAGLPGSVTILIGDGTGSFGSRTDVPGSTKSVAICDMNGDGNLDLVVAHGANFVGVLLGNGAGGFGPVSDFAGASSGPQSVAVGDLNGDGRPDIAAANYDTDLGPGLSVFLGLERSRTTLSASPDPCPLGATITLSANVAAVGLGSGAPTGVVDFFDGTKRLGTSSLSGPAAGLMIQGTRIGTRHLTAIYKGDATFSGSISPDVAERVVNGTATVQLYPSEDNTLIEDSNGAYSDGYGQWFYVGYTNGHGLRRGVLKFDLSGIPASAQISSAMLSMTCEQYHANRPRVALHRLLASWGEGTSVGETYHYWNGMPANAGGGTGAPSTDCDATWIHRFYPGSSCSDTRWSAAGGDFVSGMNDPSAVVTGSGTFSWSVLSDVQQWVSSPSTNNGWLIQGNEANIGNALSFDSRNNATVATRPTLLVTYSLGVSRGSCCLANRNCEVVTPAQCAAAGGAYHGDATLCTGNPCPAPTGACCATNGTCSTATQAQCTAAGGAYQGDGTACTADLCPVVLQPYQDDLPKLAPATPTSGSIGGTATYDIPLTEFTWQMHHDLPPTRVWGYAGKFPGPTIEAATGSPITVTWTNNLPAYNPLVEPCTRTGATTRTVVHVHGGHNPPDVDGYPTATIAPGGNTTYVYPNNQQATTLWYHDHAMGITDLNLMMGLAGFYIIRDPVENGMGLPSGNFECPLLIQDRSFNSDGSLKYALTGDRFFGDNILVNGKVWPRLSVTPGKYRFRILNGSNSRFYTLSLSTNPASVPLQPFWLIGTDGGLLPKPVAVYPAGQANARTSLTIAPAERADVVIDFSSYPVGTEILLQNSAPAPMTVPQVMKFIVVSGTAFTGPLPQTLRAFTRRDPSTAVETRTLTLGTMGSCTSGQRMWAIDGLAFDTIRENPLLHTAEIWRFVNPTSETHPMHLHLDQFQVLGRSKLHSDGTFDPSAPMVPPDSTELFWKDTAHASPDSALSLIVRFDDYTGRYPYHCHILEHEDNMMMRQFEVAPAVTFPVFDAGLPAVSFGTAAWGDYDNDGDLDLAVAGTMGGVPTTKIYRNDGGTFVDIGAALPGVTHGSLAWGDFDGDGDLDLAITGLDASSTPISAIFRNDNGTFVDIGAGLPGVSSSAIAWGDFDGDGHPDLLITGATSGSGPIARIYRNNGGIFVDMGAGLPGIMNGSVSVADFDRDGDLDILMAGMDAGSTPITRIYRNDGGTFTDIAAGLPGVFNSSVAWGDYDSDGDFDLVLAGDLGGTRIARIYRNDGGAFTDIGAGLAGVGPGSVAWGDYDNDGDLDLAITGSDGVSRVSRIYRNDQGVFEDIGAGLSGVTQGSTVAWGDYDGDLRLDLLLIGAPSGVATSVAQSLIASVIYHNFNAPPDSVPTVPTGLSASRSGNFVTFRWDAASDHGARRSGLTYNLRIGTTSHGSQVLSPMADPATGFRRIAAVGNAGKGTSLRLNLPTRKYYWSVQTIDAGFQGSPFATEQIFLATTDVPEVPAHFALHGGVPNPFAHTTTIGYDLASAGRVRLELFDARGRRVRTLVSDFQPAGRQQAVWNGADDSGHRLAPGVYLCRLRAGSFQATNRAQLMP